MLRIATRICENQDTGCADDVPTWGPRQTGKYDPADLEDRYENRLRAMVDAKVAGMPLEPEERLYERGNVIDLISALRKSLEASKAGEAKAAKAPKGPPPKRGPPQSANKATRKRVCSASAEGALFLSILLTTPKSR